LLAVAGAALAGASNANAACTGGSSQTFKQWGDLNYYSLITNGGFESTSPAWAFTGGAGIVSGNETFNLNSRNDRSSALVPASATATTPSFCVQLDTPLARFVARTGSGPTATMRVDLLCPASGGGSTAVTVARFGGSSSWAPTPQIPVTACGPAGAGSVSIQMRVVAETGSWQVDDFYLDPYKKVR
jgi:hypothetical protein